MYKRKSHNKNLHIYQCQLGLIRKNLVLVPIRLYQADFYTNVRLYQIAKPYTNKLAY